MRKIGLPGDDAYAQPAEAPPAPRELSRFERALRGEPRPSDLKASEEERLSPSTSREIGKQLKDTYAETTAEPVPDRFRNLLTELEKPDAPAEPAVSAPDENKEPEKKGGMDWDRIEGNWKQFAGKVKESWGTLTEEELDIIAGKGDRLADMLQERYGITKDEAERQIRDLDDGLVRLFKPHVDFGKLASGQDAGRVPDGLIENWAKNQEASPGAAPASAPASTAKVEPTADRVECSVFAPSVPRQGTRILIQALLHKAAELAQAIKMAHEIDPGANRKGFAKFEQLIPRGAIVELFLEVPALAIEAPHQAIVWEGEAVRTVFSVLVPHTARIGPCPGKLHVIIDAIPVGEIEFELQIAARAVQTALPGPAGGFMSGGLGDNDSFNEEDDTADPVATRIKYNSKAFISYSRKDLRDVVAYADAMERFGVRVLFDLSDIEPGTEWEEELTRLIDMADVFFLMWSTNAAASPWVEKEARRAVARYNSHPGRIPTLHTVVLELPMPDLPDYLQKFQFPVKWLALRKAGEALRAPAP